MGRWQQKERRPNLGNTRQPKVIDITPAEAKPLIDKGNADEA